MSTLVLAVSGENSNDTGQVIFVILYAFLVLYSFIIALMTFRLTSREFADGTFELYEISGMSLEKMTLGKVISMFSQFLFGFFCIAPFLFFSYLMGGVDFLVLLGSFFLLVGIVIPAYLFTLLMSMSSKGLKIGGVFRFIAVMVFLFIGLNMLSHFFSMGMRMRGGSSFIRSLLRMDKKSLGIFAFFLFMYAQLCLLLFYACCQAITRPSDTRESHIKFFLTSMSISWLIGFCVMAFFVRSMAKGASFLFGIIPLYIVMLFSGLLFYYHRMDIPPTVRKKMRESGYLKTLFYRLFRPGAPGTLQLFIIYYICVIVAAIYFSAFFTGGALDNKDFLYAFSVAFQAPFFLVFPGGLVLLFRPFRNKMKQLKIFIAVWWIFSGVGLGILSSIFSSLLRRRINSVIPIITEFISFFASPFSTLWAGQIPYSGFEESGAIFRIISGIGGFILLFVINARRKKAAEDSPELIRNLKTESKPAEG